MIPDSMRIESRLEGIAGRKYDGGNSTVSRGKYEGRTVAIKTLRLYATKNFEECLSVSVEFLLGWPEICSYRKVIRNFAEK